MTDKTFYLKYSELHRWINAVEEQEYDDELFTFLCDVHDELSDARTVKIELHEDDLRRLD